MPALNPGTTVALYKAELTGTILLDPSQPFNNVKQAGVTLIDWTINKSASVPGGSVDVAGEAITYTVVINNTGGAWLQGSLNDTLPGIYGMSGPAESGTVDGYLQPGETWTYTYYYNATQGDINNNGIDKYGVADGDGDIDNEATFTDNYGNSKSDPADVPILLNPSIDIEKYVSVDGGTTWLDADSATGPYAAVGSDVKFYVTVNNTGNVELTNIVVGDTDFTFTGIASTLAAGASDTSDVVTISAVAGQQYDLADVRGTPPVGANVTDSDPAYYFGSSPSIDLEKLVNGDDADSPTGPVVAVGSTVTFTFNVTNTGNVVLTNVVVTDDVLGNIGTIPSLAVGASQTLTKTAPAAAGQHTNVGNVTSAEGATDSDPGNYFGQSQQCTGCLKICKYEDKNGNGQKGSGESYLSGWVFNVTGPEGYSKLVTTGGGGGACGSCGGCDYCVTICNLTAGQYTITEISQAGWTCTTGNPRIVTVECNKTTTVQFGNQKLCTGCLKIYKYNDRNGNGRKDWGESYLSGWTFNVTGPQGYSQLVTTGTGGYVTISNLLPGQYTVTETPKAGWTNTDPANGSGTKTVTVSCGTTQTVKFGNKQKPCLC
jgi:uncharacterized repeat protein (TIGR01451 family)